MSTRKARHPGAAVRLWVIPPAVLTDVGTHMSEAGILGEHAPGAGLFLWNLARDLTLWATTDAESRPHLFRADVMRHRSRELVSSGLPPEVAAWLDLLLSVVYESSCAASPGGILTDAVRRLARWAERGGMAETALTLAQAAALAEPLDARAAMLAGDTALTFGRLTRADSWFQRAVAIARRVRDRHTYSGSYRRLGDVYVRQRRYAEAEDRFRRGLRAARRHKSTRTEAVEALIGLVEVAIAAGRYEDALGWERRAARVVTHDEARQANLAGACVDLWMWKEDFGRALQGLEALWMDAITVAQRMYLLARIAHAAAGAGERARLGDAWGEAWQLAHEPKSGTAQDRFRTFLELSRAAELGGDPLRARSALQAAAANANGGDDETRSRRSAA